MSVLPLLLFATELAGCASSGPAATTGSSPTFTLAYQGAVDGEIEPCG